MGQLPSISFLKPEQIKTDPASLSFYGKDWTTYFDIKASAVLFPASIKDVQDIVLWARSHKISLIPSGGRTGLSGSAVATKGEVIVSFEKMNQILGFNEVDQVVTVQAGVVTETLQQYAQRQSLYYPVDFAARGSSQIGGNIATNAGGIKVVRYGLTRDWVVGLTVVTGSGEILKLNNSLVKNATGYDLRHLFVGSEGTLGFIVEAQIKLTQPPPSLQVLILGLKDLSSTMKVFAAFQKSTTLVAFEMFSEKALQKVIHHTQLTRPLDTVCDYYVLVEVEAPTELEQEKILKTFEEGLESGLIVDGTMSQSDQQAKTFWRFREDISESLAPFSPYKNDISVSISKVPALMNDLDELLKSSYPDWEVIWFGHVGDGNLHINILRPSKMTKETFVQECRKVDRLVFESVQRQSGSISAEHGVGLTKKSFLVYSRSEEEIKLMRGIKQVFDPDGIMNPGKIFD